MQPWPVVLGWLSLMMAGGADPPGVVAWPAGPLEVRATSKERFDPAVVSRIVGTTIPFHDQFRSRFETVRHGPLREAPRYSIRIAAARLVDGGRTLVLATDPHPREAVYMLAIPGMAPVGRVAYDLTGVEAAWDEGGDDAQPVETGWGPLLDPGEVRWLSAGATEHERRYAVLSRPGRLTLRSLVRLPKGKVTLRLAGRGLTGVTSGADEAKADANGRASLPIESTGDLTDLAVTLRTGEKGGPPTLATTYQAGDDPAEHVLFAESLVVPWAPSSPSSAPAAAEAPFDLSGGDRARGEAVFRGDQAKCASCHKVRGQGGDVGPDLSDLVGKPRIDVYRDIYDPSATIRPDYLAYTVATRDGRVVVGTVRAEGADAIRVIDTDAKATVIRRDEIDQFQASPASIMPVGLVGVIGEEKTRDLLAFLTTPPQPAPPRGTLKD
jgi:putative heme-binding domain-containing protein